MAFNVNVSVQFTSETEEEANSIIAALGLPPGAIVSTSVLAFLDESTGTVDDGGNIVPPEPPAPPPVVEPGA